MLFRSNITNMLNKEQGVKWTSEAKTSFELVKQALTKTPALISLDFSKEFYIFSFASEHTIVFILLQKNPQGQEQPIAFFSKALRDATLSTTLWKSKLLRWLRL